MINPKNVIARFCGSRISNFERKQIPFSLYGDWPEVWSQLDSDWRRDKFCLNLKNEKDESSSDSPDNGYKC